MVESLRCTLLATAAGGTALTTLSIPLVDIVLDPIGNPHHSGLTDAALAAALQPYYTFLGPDARITVEDNTLTITMPDVSFHQEDRARRSYERAVKSAERGSYNRAIPAFEQALDTLPTRNWAGCSLDNPSHCPYNRTRVLSKEVPRMAGP